MGRKNKSQVRAKCKKCGKSWLTDTYAFSLHMRDCKGKKKKA